MCIVHKSVQKYWPRPGMLLYILATYTISCLSLPAGWFRKLLNLTINAILKLDLLAVVWNWLWLAPPLKLLTLAREARGAISPWRHWSHVIAHISTRPLNYLDIGQSRASVIRWAVKDPVTKVALSPFFRWIWAESWSSRLVLETTSDESPYIMKTLLTMNCSWCCRECTGESWTTRTMSLSSTVMKV